MEGKVVLGYWKIRGLAERIRMILEYLGLPYQQTFYTSETRDKWFSEVKPDLIKKNSAVTLPYLMDGEKLISESNGIIVHIIHKAQKVELLGRNCDEQVAIATASGVMNDVHREYVTLVYGRSGKPFEEAKVEYVEKFKIPLAKLSGILGEKEYFAGEITWVDFAIAEFMQTLWLLEPALFENFQNILNHQKRIWELPAIKAYHESDRWQERPCNNAPPAQWV